MYRQILDILSPAGKRLIVHYDGKLRVIADDIASWTSTLTRSPRRRRTGASRWDKAVFAKDSSGQPFFCLSCF